MKGIFFSLITLLLLISTSVHSQQILGGDITWECVGSGAQQGKYIFTLTLYNLCIQGSAPTGNQTIEVQNANINSFLLSFQSDVDINPPCYDPMQEVSCVNSTFDALSKATYVSQPVQLSGTPPSSGWVFTYKNCCRPGSANIQGNPGITLKSILYSDTIIGGPTCFDNSPRFIDHPSPQSGIGYTFNITNRAYDPDQDKVVHSWAVPLDSNGNGINWQSGYNINNQFPGTIHSPNNAPATILPYNGEINLYVNSYAGISRHFFTTRIASYRDSVLVSEIFKESVVHIKTCPPTPTIPPLTNAPPAVTFKDSSSTSVFRPFPISDTIWAGDSVSLFIQTTDVQNLPGFIPQTNYLIPRSSQFGYAFSDRANGCDDPPCATIDTNQYYNSAKGWWEGQFGLATNFKWVTDSSQGSPNGDVYQFHFYVRDDWCPTPGINEHTYTVVVLRPDNYLSGVVYKDSNGNGSQNSNDPGFENILVKQSPNNYYLNSKSNGEFVIGAQNGTNILKAIAPRYHTITEPNGGIYTVQALGYGHTYSGKDFGIHPVPNVNDLLVNVTSLGPTRPGWNKYYIVNYKNIGTTTLSGNVELSLDTRISHISSSPNHASNVGNDFTWNYSNLMPFETRTLAVYVNLDTSIQMGDSVWTYALINPISGDTVPPDNMDSILNIATLSWDPNLKSVNPNRDFYLEEVKNRNLIEYTVHFQNTGTDTAFQVRVVDQLENSLNIETIEMLGSSHNYTYQIKGRTIEWLFDDIQLPDSIRNEPESHGFIKFRIEADTSLNLGDSVFNQVGIYFDFNIPIITDVTSFIVNEPTDTTSAIFDIVLNKSVNLFPNPTTGHITLLIETKRNDVISIKIHNVTGTLLSKASISTNSGHVEEDLDMSGLKPGLYFVSIKGNGIDETRKIIRQ